MRVTGLLGSLFVALGGFVIGRTPPRDWVSRLDPLADVRTWPPGVDAGYALAFVGLGLLTWAWLGLGPLVRGRPDGVTHVRTAVLLWALPLLPTPPLFSGDGWSYVADGLLTGRHLSPYVVPPAALTGPIHEAVNSRWLHAPAPYGPLPMLWGGAAAHLSGNLWLMLYAYRALALVGLFLLMYAVPRFAALAGRDPATASWLAVGSPLVLAHGVAGLHLDLVMVGLMALALLLAATRGWLPAAVVAGAAMAVKLPALFVLVGVVLLSLPGGSPIGRIRRAVGVGAVATGTMVALGVSGGIGVGFLGALRVHWTHPSWLSATLYVGLLVHWLTGLPAVPVVAVGGVLLLGVVTVLVVLRTPLGDPVVAAAAAAVVLGLATMVAPLVHYWYFLWCLPILACARLDRVSSRVVVGLTLALGVVAPIDPSWTLPYAPYFVRGAIAAVLVIAVLPPSALDRLVSRGWWRPARHLARVDETGGRSGP